MSPRVLHHRQVAASGCPAPCVCEGHLDDPAFACPNQRFSAWYGEGGATPAEQPPTLWSKLKNVSLAFLKWRAAGYPKRSKAEIKACLALCHDCPHWSAKGNLGLGECHHPRCGCTSFKPQFATEHCPINKW